MQIEETFRDLKSHRWGFGLRYSLSARPKRLDILLLLGTLGSFVAWLMGLVARNLQIERHFHANTEQRRRVLSTVFIGRLYLNRLTEPVSNQQVSLAILDLKKLIHLASPT
jgi:hypothetical protein